MENPRPEKVAVVEEVRDRLSSSSAALLTEYRGINVKDMATLRRALRDAGGEYKIYKNTLVRFAVRDLGIEGVDDLLLGTTAIAFVPKPRGDADGADAAAVAKALRDFARTNPNLVVKGGLLGEKVLAARDVGALADLPPREVLLARLAGGLAAPLQQLAGLLQALPRNMAYGLKALIDQGGNPGVAEAPPAAAAEPEPTPAADEPETAPAAEEAVDAGEAIDAGEGSAEPANMAEVRSDEPVTDPAPEATAEEPAPEAETAAAPPADEPAPEAETAAETAAAPPAEAGEGETRPEENPKPDPSEQEPAEGSPETTEES